MGKTPKKKEFEENEEDDILIVSPVELNREGLSMVKSELKSLGVTIEDTKIILEGFNSLSVKKENVEKASYILETMDNEKLEMKGFKITDKTKEVSHIFKYLIELPKKVGVFKNLIIQLEFGNGGFIRTSYIDPKTKHDIDVFG